MHVPNVDLKRHEHLRSIVRAYQNAAAAKIPIPLLRRAAREFGRLQGKQLALDTDGELIILMDHVLYDRADRGRTTARRYLDALSPTTDAEERSVRDAMAGQRYSLFEIATVHNNLGLISRDLVRGGTVFVVDLAMSTIAVPGMLMSERLLPVRDYWTPSGSGFPITPEAAWQVQQTIVPALEASEDDLAAMSPEANAELATALIKLGFKEGSTGEIEFR
jgi:hypothetical protein